MRSTPRVAVVPRVLRSTPMARARRHRTPLPGQTGPEKPKQNREGRKKVAPDRLVDRSGAQEQRHQDKETKLFFYECLEATSRRAQLQL
jgi:hypothetical protein